MLTYCDDATGERVDLTPAEMGGWAARTANLLRDGCRLRAGDRAAVLLPPHWQTAAVLLGAWSAGIAVSFHPWATAGLDPWSEGGAVDAVFVSRARLGSWLETVPEAVHRYVAVDTGPVPPGWLDFLGEVRGHPPTPPAYREIRPGDPASPDGTSYGEWAQIARGTASALRLGAGDRVLVDVSAHEQPVTWLLAPLSVGASVVLCANLDRARLDDRIAAEGITRVL